MFKLNVRNGDIFVNQIIFNKVSENFIWFRIDTKQKNITADKGWSENHDGHYEKLSIHLDLEYDGYDTDMTIIELIFDELQKSRWTILTETFKYGCYVVCIKDDNSFEENKLNYYGYPA